MSTIEYILLSGNQITINERDATSSVALGHNSQFMDRSTFEAIQAILVSIAQKTEVDGNLVSEVLASMTMVEFVSLLANSMGVQLIE